MSENGSVRGVKQVQGGRGGRGGRGRGRSSRRYRYSGATIKHKRLCSAIGIHVFEYGHKASVDQRRITRENLVHRVVKIHGHDISN